MIVEGEQVDWTGFLTWTDWIAGDTTAWAERPWRGRSTSGTDIKELPPSNSRLIAQREQTLAKPVVVSVTPLSSWGQLPCWLLFSLDGQFPIRTKLHL